MSLEIKYPLLSKFVDNTYSGDVTLEEFIEFSKAYFYNINIDNIEKSLKMHPDIVEDGMPYPNTNIEFDEIRSNDPALEDLQCLLSEFD